MAIGFRREAGGSQEEHAGEAVWEKPVLSEAALLKSSWASRLSESDGKAAGALRRGRAESRLRGSTEAVFVFGLLHPRGSLGWGCNLLGDQCYWAERFGEAEE